MQNARSVVAMLHAESGTEYVRPQSIRVVAAASILVLAAVGVLVWYPATGVFSSGEYPAASANAARSADDPTPTRPADFWRKVAVVEGHEFHALFVEAKALTQEVPAGVTPDLRLRMNAMLARWPIDEIATSPDPCVTLLVTLVNLGRHGGDASHRPFLEQVHASTWYPANKFASWALRDLDARIAADGAGDGAGAASAGGAGPAPERD